VFSTLQKLWKEYFSTRVTEILRRLTVFLGKGFIWHGLWIVQAGVGLDLLAFARLVEEKSKQGS